MMLTLILCLAPVVGPDIPYVSHSTKLFVSPGPIAEEVGNYWRDCLPSDDGEMIVYKDRRLLWTPLPNGPWSQPEAVFARGQGPSLRFATTSQDAHLPGADDRRLANFLMLASYSDRSVVVAASGGSNKFDSICRINFQSRGSTPNPVAPFSGAPEDILIRQVENSSTTGAVLLKVGKVGVRISSIRWTGRRGQTRIQFGKAIDFPLAREPDEDVPGGSPSLHRGLEAPMLVDLARRRAVYPDFSRDAQKNWRLGLREYSTATHKWKMFPLPRGFANYSGPSPADGIFYWQGHLLFSPQYPAGAHESRFAMSGAGSAGLYEANSARTRWKKISNWTVKALSATKSAWLLRSPLDQSYWIAHAKAP